MKILGTIPSTKTTRKKTKKSVKKFGVCYSDPKQILVELNLFKNEHEDKRFILGYILAVIATLVVKGYKRNKGIKDLDTMNSLKGFEDAFQVELWCSPRSKHSGRPKKKDHKFKPNLGNSVI